MANYNPYENMLHVLDKAAEVLGYKKNDYEFVRYPERELTICREGDHFVCRVKIDNRQAILQSLYVKASPNNPLNVEYVELQGIATDTGVPVTEKVSK